MNDPDSKDRGANMGPHVGPMNFAIRGLKDTVNIALQKKNVLLNEMSYPKPGLPQPCTKPVLLHNTLITLAENG